MEETQHDSPLSEPGSTDVSWWPPDFLENLKSVSLAATKESSDNYTYSARHHELSPHAASQVLWHTGCFSGHIPNGFYTAIPDKKLKELFEIIPSLDEFYSLGELGHKADIIYVDAEKDKKLSMLKQLSATFIKGQNINPASLVKKIAGLVSDFYKRPSSDLSPAKSSLEENSQFTENRVIQFLGQIKNASCRARAVLFKILADVAGMESKLLVGLPTDGNSELMDAYKHLSVVVVLNSVELVVDLMRFPGQLIPLTTRSFCISHASTAGESDSAENDSCDSPHEPNSPLYPCQNKLDSFGHGTDECLQSWNQQRSELSQNLSGPSRRSLTMRPTSGEVRLSSSNSESNIANAVWRRNRRKVVAEQRTASSSPEHPLLRSRGRSMLSGDKQSTGELAEDNMFTSRSDGAKMSDIRKMRRRSISITPEIGDDIVRAVRAMNETLKQNNLLRGLGDEVVNSYSTHGNKNCDKQSNDASRYTMGHEDEKSNACINSRNEVDSYQKSALLSSSQYDLGIETCSRSGDTGMLEPANCVSTWKKVLQSSLFSRPILPFQEWKIEFTELTVGTRVGIGFFGEVFRGAWSGTEVAIKVFLEQDLNAENMEDFCNEISILSRLRHPNGTDETSISFLIGYPYKVNVILFLGACLRPPHLSMVTEYMERGSLYYLIHTCADKKRLSWRRRLRMLQDICRGLMCIHRMKIIHRDIKSANCLVNKHWTVKICDFGLSKVATDVPVRDHSCAGTPEWMAPELIRREPFTEKCDIFSLGVIIWELCTLRRPWEGIPPVQVIHAVANEGSRLDVPEGPLKKLIEDCWSEPDERPCCEEILSRLVECEYTLC